IGPRRRSAQSVAEGHSDTALRARDAKPATARPRAGRTTSPAIAISGSWLAVVPGATLWGHTGLEAGTLRLAVMLEQTTTRGCRSSLFGSFPQALSHDASAMLENRSSNRAGRAKG